jgi:hypothetical protein
MGSVSIEQAENAIIAVRSKTVFIM